jgi:TolB-like protein/AraC-like DNA-binding protein
MSQDEQLLNDLRQTVLENLENEQFSVEQLSQIVGVSRSHLHRKLKKLKGQSISQFIREIRLAEALKLLRQDVATTSEIAYRVGFNSPSYFHKCFLEYYGYSPSEAKRVFQNPAEDETVEDKGDIQSATVSDRATLIVSGEEEGKGSFNFKLMSFFVSALLVAACLIYYFWSRPDATAVSLEKSIAVLPFNNLSEDEGNQHFADGLVEDLLNRLALIDEFKVISRTSSDTYRERGKKRVSEIATELGVSYIVEGSVQKYDDKARITIQLIDAKDDKHLWIKTFDRDVADVFKIQSEIAVHVATELSTVLTEQQSIDIQKNQTENVKAFELYQFGRHHWSKRTHDGLQKSITYFEEAINEDSTFALAIANKADSYFLLSFHKAVYKDYSTKAKQLALKALEMDNRQPEAYNVLGGIYSFVDLDWAAAEIIFLEGLKYNPNHSNLHHRYSEHLSMTGRKGEARNHLDRAIELDPLSFVIRTISAQNYYSRGQFKEALAEVKICNELIPDPYHGRISLTTFSSYFFLKKEQEALEYLKGWEASRIDSSSKPSPWDSIYTSSGIKGLVLREAELTQYAFGKANLYGLCKEYEKALDFLDIAYNNEPTAIQDILIYSDSNFKGLHSNSRYIALLKKMNLPWSPDPTH